MIRVLRPISFVLVLGSILWLVPTVPSAIDSTSDQQTTGLLLGKLIRDVLDPWLLLLILLGGLTLGRTRGTWRAVRHACGLSGHIDELTKPATRAAFLGGGRAWLWGAFCLNAIYLTSFYWPLSPSESVSGLALSHRRNFVSHGALFAASFPCLVLLPMGEALRSSATRRARLLVGADSVALLGLMAGALTMLLSVYSRTAPLAGDEASMVFLAPTFMTVDVHLVLWSAAVVPLLYSISWFAGRRTGGDAADFCLCSRTLLAAGVVAAMMIAVHGINEIASLGGQAEAGALPALAGRMLIPMAMVMASCLARRLWNCRRS